MIIDVFKNKLFYNVCARILYVIAQLVLLRLYASLVSPAELGFFYFLTTVSYSFNAVIFIPIDYFNQAKLFGPKNKAANLERVLGTNAFVIALTLVVFLVIAFAIQLIQPNYLYQLLLVYVLSLLIFLISTARNYINNCGRSDAVSISTIIEGVSKCISVYFLVSYFDDKVFALLVAWLIGLFVPLFYLITKCMSPIKLDFNKRYNFSELIKFCYPISFGSIANWLQTQGYRLIMVPMGYSEIVGIYVMVTSIGSAGIGIITLIFNQHFHPLLYRLQAVVLKKLCFYALILIIVAGFAYLAAGSFIVNLLLENAYSKYWYLGLYGIFIDGAYMIFGILSIYASARNINQLIIYPTFFVLIIQAATIFYLYLYKLFTVSMVGAPILLSQIMLATILYWILYAKQSDSIDEK